jgi:glycosyltransferase involved in cell wall biosynthesis
VAGDAAVLVDPYDAEGMAAALTEVVHNEPLRRTLQCKGIAQAQKFSWDTAAKQTLDLYIALGG